MAATVLTVSPDGPIRGLAEARDAIRTQRIDKPNEAFRVVVEDGVYRITEPILFEVGDGNVIYEAAPDASPILSGGQRITSKWTKVADADGLWKCDLSSVKRFEQLWVNGTRAIRAREPDSFFHYLRDAKQVDMEDGRRARQVLAANPGDLTGLKTLSEDEIRDVQLLAFHKWDITRRFLDDADPASGRLVVSGRPMKPWNPLTRNTGFVLENYAGALDEPGEFFLSKDGWLTYRPRPDEVLSTGDANSNGDAKSIAKNVAKNVAKNTAESVAKNTAECVFPVCDQLLIVQGDSANGRFVEDLVFRGISFRHSGHETPPGGHEPAQAAAYIEASVQVDGARNVVIEDCEIAHVSNYGVWFRKGCSGCRLQNSWLHDLGAGGVRIGEMSIAAKESDRTRENSVDNNIIHDAGHLFPCAVGGWIGNSGFNDVTHNEIADMYYTGISVGWRWGYDESLAKNNRVEFNHIHHIGKGWLSDMGGIYTLGPSPGTVLRGNRIHDIESWGYGGWGLYNDEGSTGILLENNLVYRTKSGGYHQHYGRENIIRNNIFAFGREYQVRRSKAENHLSFTFERNIVLYDSETLFYGKWGDDGVKIGGNLYWRIGGDVDLGEVDTSEESTIENPRFADPENDDFQLIDETATSKIGFQRFDWHRAGVYGRKAWVEKASVLPMPERSVPPEPLPPPPPTFEEDFEDQLLPLGIGISVEKNRSDIRVIESPLAKSGKHVLELVDAPGQKHRYYPMFTFEPKLREGVGTCRFSIRLNEGSVFQHEWRDSATPYRTGPSLWFEKGELRSGDKVLMEIPVGKWIDVEVTAGLGKKAGQWMVSVAGDGVENHVFRDLPLVHPQWKHLDWIGFVSQANTDAVVYLDDLDLDVRK
ncbi:right-handed parallel beta-helix repeat-containing protein [Rhodopirellula sallentina]|uniref:Right handed beta helix domain-containing protein n=1 Tax=Rhodopirellula sallentina SM41 TaxID=1263870 RepID=M5U6P3_9BACT|nr:right-handed parallel beta-helix repeat-containing protein [Rhodopirellula sallentina]EMI57105.1 hypothetical protein RSSM_01451 [Rhodopirellula sallentina SM41]